MNRTASVSRTAFTVAARQTTVRGSQALFARSYAVGQNLLDGQANLKGVDGKDLPLTDLFKGKKVVVFGLPGAFTPVCTSRHVPGYVDSADKFKAKGVDNVVCVSVNDPFVMKAWGDSLKANNITLVADWDGSFTKLVDKELDLSAAGLGKRCRRYSLVVDNGKIVKENIENAPNDLQVTSAEAVLAQL